MAQHTEFHKRLDVFKLWVLAWPSPIVYLKTLLTVVESLRADFDAILEVQVPESKDLTVEPVEDRVLTALFSTIVVPPLLPRDRVKTH